MLEGLKIYELRKLPDEQGFSCELLRMDWKEILGEEWIVQADLSCSYPGMVRGWYRHLRGQTDYFIVLEGAMKICAYSEETGELDEVIASEDKLQVVRVPGHYWHGSKTISVKPSLTIYFVTRLYNYKDPDQQRRAWNDPKIVPKSLNGREDDPRVGKPWDWFYPPHK